MDVPLTVILPGQELEAQIVNDFLSADRSRISTSGESNPVSCCPRKSSLILYGII